VGLQEYARKRRFGDTPEPDDGAVGKTGQRPIFVVQLHHARARHYDFRLEADGVLKSWAVPKGPSLRVGEKRLAVEVEDHPLDYADFAGDIPAGNYGAGHVQIFDHGVWACDGDPLEGLAKGKLDFVLEGEKLRGGWKLIRTAKRASKPQWLLLKRDDAYAADLEADDLLADGAGAPVRAGKKSGRQASPPRPAQPGSAAKASRPRKTKGRVDWKARARSLEGAKPLKGGTEIAPQLATLQAAPPGGDDWLHELKWDGYRLLATIDDGRVRLRSRNGLDWTGEHPVIVDALERLGLDSASLDGELIALDAKGNDSFSTLQHTLKGTARGDLRYVVFDLPTLAGIDLTATRLDERKGLLAELLDTAGTPGPLLYSEHVTGHGAEVFAASRTQGMEGIISKAADARYTPRRSHSWLKIKHAQGDEFVVVGFMPPQRSRIGFASLLLATRREGELVYVGRVGIGFDDGTLRRLAARLKPMVRKQPTVPLPAHVAFPVGNAVWVKPEIVVEVAFRGWGKEGLLRQASYQRLREDKSADEVGSAAPASARSQNKKEDPKMAAISSPDRVVYPDAGITKQEVADYYTAIADWLLPEVADRPLSLLRCPDGIVGECFFQKHHAEAFGDSVHAISVRAKDGGKSNYMVVRDVEGLRGLVQMGTLELHPWGARGDDLEHPDRLVFDLDPGDGVAWKAVVAAARDLRDRLEELGMQSFVRLTGGKGIHVVVPIAPGPSWTQAKTFCEGFADAMASSAPERYVATASKALRDGVVFIDWLRNSRGATSVASWSLRARPGAPAAVPLRWSELGRTASGADYPLARALRRASSLGSDPWEGWSDAVEQSLVDWS